jgi:hypothetical protein
LEEETVCGADNVGFRVVGGEEIELLEGSIWTEERPLREWQNR